MTDSAIPPAEPVPPPRRRSRGIGFAVFVMFLLLGLLAGLCAYRWAVVLPAGRIAALEERLAQVERGLDDKESGAPAVSAAPAAADDMARMQTEMNGISASLASLQGAVKQAGDAAQAARDATQGMIAAAVAYIRLDAAARSGRAFTVELAAMRSATARHPEFQSSLAALDAYAATGAPGVTALQQEWDALTPRLAASIEREHAQGWKQKLLAEMHRLVSIRSAKDAPPDAIAAVNADLARGDTAAALGDLAKLPDAEATEGWRHKLEARRAVDEALSSMAARFDETPILP